MGKNINLQEQKIFMSKVVFDRKENLQGNFKIVAKDKINNLKIDDNGIAFKYERHVKLDPEALFDIVVEFVYSAKFDKDTLEFVKNKNFDIPMEVIIKVVNNSTIPQNASLVISNLTYINGGNPLITPPTFCE